MLTLRGLQTSADLGTVHLIRMSPQVQLILSLALLFPRLKRQSFIMNHRSYATGVTSRTYSMNSTGIAQIVMLANTISARDAIVLVKDAFIGMVLGMQRYNDINEKPKTHRNRKIHHLLMALLDIDTGDRTRRWSCRRLPRVNEI